MYQFYDIFYSSVNHVLRAFDLYSLRHPEQINDSPLICFVHGGAWRSEDKSQHANLARKLAVTTGLPVAVPNYRLTRITDSHIIRHPEHSEDLLEFLTYLMARPKLPGFENPYNPHSLILMGHSCSAHMLASIFLDSTSTSPSLNPPLALLGAIKGIILTEGIYDIDQLLARFPSYKEWFIEPAFGSRESYALFNAASFQLRTPGIAWLIMHSPEDKLVDTLQSEIITNHLRNLYGSSADLYVTYNGELPGDHDGVLEQDQYYRLVEKFVGRFIDQ